MRLRIFKTAWFAKAARKADIPDRELCAAISQVMSGQADDLGGGVYKKRLKKNHYRCVILAKVGQYWVYEYLFAKQDRANIDDDELDDFRKLAKAYSALNRPKSTNLSETSSGRRSAMATKRKFKSDAFEAIHSSATALSKVGAIDKVTLREFDQSCLTAPPALTPAQIKKLRLRLRISQPVFARYLNTSESTVEKWETGAKQPSGMALKLLSVVQKHGIEVLS